MSDQPKRPRKKPRDDGEWMVQTHYCPRNDPGDETITLTTSHGPFSCRDAAEMYVTQLAGHSPAYRGCNIYRVDEFRGFRINHLHTEN